MTIQSIAHHVVPASIRDIGTGIYHLAKKDATEEQCQKLVAGAIRVAAAAAIVLTTIAANALLPVPLGFLVSIVVIIPTRFMDMETWGLVVGGNLIASGLGSVAMGIGMLARGIFAEGSFELIFGTAITGLGWLATRLPRDITVSGSEILKEKIDDFAYDWGLRLYYRLNPGHSMQ